MSTTTRPELSKKNKFWIERHRYYELKHFCLQYPEWKKSLASIETTIAAPAELIRICDTNNIPDPVSKCVEARMFYIDRIAMVERAAKNADADLANYILKGVTASLSYDILRARMDIPCCREVYYEAYRRFFWLLDRERN